MQSPSPGTHRALNDSRLLLFCEGGRVFKSHPVLGQLSHSDKCFNSQPTHPARNSPRTGSYNQVP